MVRIYPAHFVYIMRLEYLIAMCVFLGSVGCLASDNAAPGFLEGRFRILAFNDAELAEEPPKRFSDGNYAEYPLIILSQDGKREIARVPADKNGKYRITLPPGDYILDVQGRMPKGHVRSKPQPFTITSNRTVNVDKTIDTGVR
jgi:hypothetical protein